MRASSSRARGWFAALLAVSAAGCAQTCNDAPGGSGASNAAGSVSAAASSTPPAFAGDSGKLGEGDWPRAADGDPADLDRLARREGALGLMKAVRSGGARGRVALSALPYAPDAELVLAELCALAQTVATPDVGPVLGAVHGIATRPVPPERYAADAKAKCLPALAELATRPALSPSERDLASSARRLLSGHATAGKQ